jgi:hypothetical protein
MINKSKALQSLCPNSDWILRDNKLEWLDSVQTQPTEEQIQARIAELTAAEPMRQLRIQRDQLLSATDWWCVSDRTATPEQLAYRQALRDLPSTASPALDEDGQLTGVTWPEKPAT